VPQQADQQRFVHIMRGADVCRPLLSPSPLRSKGISRSAKPYRRSAPSWLKIGAPQVIDNITKLAKKGLTPSQIGVTLRDSHGIAQVKTVTGNKILRLLKTQGESFRCRSTGLVSPLCHVTLRS
jgi:hypothetical protein